MLRACAFLFALLAAPSGVRAHELVPGATWRAWTLEPAVVLALAASLVLYGMGVQRVWQRAGFDRGVRNWQAWCFGSGVLVLAVAMVSPLHALGSVLFSAHMTQHVVLMSLAAPLLVLGAPLVAMTWALPPGGRRRVARVLNAPLLRRTGGWLTTPLVAWLLHAAAIWVWHVPGLYVATLGSEWVHTAQHASFFGTALVFWWALRDRTTHGLGVVYLFTTAVHSSLLGALLAFSPGVFYAPYALTAPSWGFTALEDQQVGGLIMWVPAGLVYFGAALLLLASWLRSSDRRVGSPDSPVARGAARAVGRAAVVVALCAGATGCGRGELEQRGTVAGGDRHRGEAAVRAYGCGACHEIRGVRGANGRVGPSLSDFHRRVYIAGYMPNEPEALVRWIMSPASFRNPTAMPDLGVTEQDARDIAAYLYSLRR